MSNLCYFIYLFFGTQKRTYGIESTSEIRCQIMWSAVGGDSMIHADYDLPTSIILFWIHLIITLKSATLTATNCSTNRKLILSMGKFSSADWNANSPGFGVLHHWTSTRHIHIQSPRKPGRGRIPYDEQRLGCQRFPVWPQAHLTRKGTLALWLYTRRSGSSCNATSVLWALNRRMTVAPSPIWSSFEL